jgi:hypothetical protein
MASMKPGNSSSLLTVHLAGGKGLGNRYVDSISRDLRFSGRPSSKKREEREKGCIEGGKKYTTRKSKARSCGLIRMKKNPVL